MSKQAKIKCPHCGESIIVRTDSGEAPPILDDIWEAADELWKSVDQGFKKVFDPKNWHW